MPKSLPDNFKLILSFLVFYIISSGRCYYSVFLFFFNFKI